jgi:hypothetical protein
MAAAKHNITVGRGEDFSFTLTIADSDGAVNISNNTFKAEVRRDAGKPLVATFSVTIEGAAAGKVKVKLPKAETLKLDGNARYKWDLFRIESSGNTTRLIYGDLQIENNITDF